MNDGAQNRKERPEVMKCERCGIPLNSKPDLKDSLVVLDMGNTHLTICRRCAEELTLLIGHWLGTEPMDDPVAWFLEATA